MEQATAKSSTLRDEPPRVAARRALLPGFERPAASAPHMAPKSLSLPGLLAASLVVHVGIGAVLSAIPIASFVAHGLEDTWVSFDLEPLAAPEPLPVVEAPPPTPAVPVEPEVRRVRPEPREEIVPEPEPVVEVTPEPIAPPSIDDVFAEEPAPPAESLMAAGTGGFAVAPGEPGGLAGGIPGGRGTTLTSSVHPATVPAPTGPSDADRRRARRSYVRSLEDLLRAHTRYPRAAARAGLQGRVELALRIGADGRLIATRVAHGSGHDVLDQAALDAARELSRVPSPPLLAALADSDEVRVGVVYVVQ
jgi:protein TonB